MRPVGRMLSPNPSLDVVHLRAGRPRLALGDPGDRDRAELVAERSDRICPQRVGADRLRVQRALKRLDDLEDRYLGGLAGERVAALHSALALEDAGTAEGGEHALEKLHRDVPAACDLADRDRAGTPYASQFRERPDRVRRLGSDGEQAAASLGYGRDGYSRSFSFAAGSLGPSGRAHGGGLPSVR